MHEATLEIERLADLVGLVHVTVKSPVPAGDQASLRQFQQTPADPLPPPVRVNVQAIKFREIERAAGLRRAKLAETDHIPVETRYQEHSLRILDRSLEILCRIGARQKIGDELTAEDMLIGLVPA